MSDDEERLSSASMSLGMMRAACAALEAASPNSPEARTLWHESLKILRKAINCQWEYTDTLSRPADTSTESTK